MIKLVVFDFDGTLADTREIIIELIKKNVEEMNFKFDKKVLIDHGEPLDKVLKIIGVQEKVIPVLAGKINFSFIEHASRVKAVSNLKSLKQINKKKIVLSNNTKDFIEEVLKNLKAEFFDEIHGADGSIDKIIKFKELLNKNGLSPKEVIYVGDRPFDTNVAEEVGCISIIVNHKASWSSAEKILASNPDYIVSDLSKIKKIVGSLDKKVKIKA